MSSLFASSDTKVSHTYRLDVQRIKVSTDLRASELCTHPEQGEEDVVVALYLQ